MKRSFFVLTNALVVAALLMGGCASATPAPKATSPASAPASTPASTSASSAPAKTYNWKMTSSFPPGHNANRSINEFAKALEQRTNGAVKITVYESTLGTPTDAWDMVKSNTAQFTWTGEAFNLSRMPVGVMISLPFESTGAKATSLVANEWLKTGYLKELTDNFKVLHFMPVGLQHFFFRDKKVTSMDDLKRLKLRSISGLQSQTVTALGATGVSLAGGEIYMGLDRKVIDGVLTGIDSVVDRKLFEVTKYALKLPIIEGMFVLLMNKETWDSLPPDLQKTIEQISQDVSNKDLKNRIEEEQSYWETVGKKIEVYTLSPEEEARWRKAVAEAGIADKYVQETAAKGYPAKEALELMRKVVKENEK